MSEARKLARRWMLEATVIVGSILLAFAIDAWWEELQEREIEAEALEVLVRDLESAEAQLADFNLFARDKSTAAFEVGRRLGAEVPREEEGEIMDLISRAAFRRTVALPRSGYTELVSAGSLRMIRNAQLRDHILRFYQEAERMEEIVEKNSTQGTDEGLSRALIGLAIPRMPENPINDLVAQMKARVEGLRGPDADLPRARLWSQDVGSEVRMEFRGHLYRVGTLESVNTVIVDQLSDASRALRLELIDYLAELGRPVAGAEGGEGP